MKIRPTFILLLGVLCYVKFVDSQIVPNQVVSAGLPSNLIECYNDSFITTPDNLLPMTLSTFLALIRKAEGDPTIGQTDFRTMTSALLHRFRFDGLMLNPDIQASPGVIPFSAKGNEFSTYRLIMDYIIPDPNIYFNNYTFTRIERCTLHRMLSLSVDPWMRQDNDAICSNLMNDVYIGKLNLRIPRDVSKLDDVEVFDATKKSDGEESNNFMYGSNLNVNYQTPRSNCPIENGVIYTPSGSLNPGLVLAGIAAGSSAQEYVDPSIMMLVQPRPGSGRPPLRQQPPPAIQPNPRDPFFGNRNRNTFLQQNSPGQNYPGGNNYPGGGGSNYPGGGGSNYPGGGSNYPGGGYPGSGGYPSSGGFPGAGGGSGFPGGSNYPGGSGGYPGAGGNYPRGGSNTIKKGWAATMAGILAQYALLQGPTGQMDTVIGVKGGWNDSISTKYYFLQDPTPDNLPDTRIRGALDGLIMAKSIQKWSGQAGNSNNFKLSQLLTMYYSSIGVFDPSAVACNRVQRVGNVMPQADTADQTNNFAAVLINHLPSAATINPQNIWSYSSQAANDVINIATQLGSGACGQNNQNNGGQPGTPQGNQPKAYPTADIYLVVDLSYSYQGITNIMQYIMESTYVNPYRSNITVLTAKSCPVLNSTLILSAQNTLDAQVSFTNYSSCIAGFDFLFSLVQIKSLMQAKLSYDYQLGLNPPYNNDIPRVVVFIPSQGVSIDSNTANLALNRFQDFQTSIPDTKFLYLTSGPADRWNQFSNGTHPDIFPLSREGQGFRVGINKLVQRISEIQRRITNPTCGPHWNRGYTYNQMTLSENILYNEIQYFRVHPNYFFSSSSGSIIVQPTQGTVQVCMSRTNPWPNRNTTSSGGATCRSVSGGSSYTVISLSSSMCSSSYATQCNPIYFSVQSIQAAQQSNPSTCNDQTCEFPNMINYKITHSGLTCYSNALSILASPILILLMLATYFVNT